MEDAAIAQLLRLAWGGSSLLAALVQTWLLSAAWRDLVAARANNGTVSGRVRRIVAERAVRSEAGYLAVALVLALGALMGLLGGGTNLSPPALIRSACVIAAPLVLIDRGAPAPAVSAGVACALPGGGAMMPGEGI